MATQIILATCITEICDYYFSEHKNFDTDVEE